MPDSVQSVEMAWTWGSIIKLSVTTGFATAVLNQGFSWLKETAQRRESDRRAGTMLALSLVETLTRYAQECNARVRENRWDASVGEYGTSKIPDLPAYKETDSGWAVIPAKISAELIDFRNQKDYATKGISENDVVNGPEDAIDSATYHCVDLGYKAWKISQRLRKNYGLGSYSGNTAFADELKADYYKQNPSFFYNIWRSYPVYRLRRFGRRQLSRFRYDRDARVAPVRPPRSEAASDPTTLKADSERNAS